MYKKAAEALADPAEFKNLFPDFDVALQAEHMVRSKQGAKRIPAASFPEFENVGVPNLIEELKALSVGGAGDADGEAEDQDEAEAEDVVVDVVVDVDVVGGEAGPHMQHDYFFQPDLSARSWCTSAPVHTRHINTGPIGSTISAQLTYLSGKMTHRCSGTSG